jgi:hypothetical protein
MISEGLRALLFGMIGIFIVMTIIIGSIKLLMWFTKTVLSRSAADKSK